LTNLHRFPDGRIVYGINRTWTPEDGDKAARLRTANSPFILNELKKRFNLRDKRVGILGHSLGGATAASSMLKDPRFLAGIDLDGAFHGPVVRKGLKNPLLLWCSEQIGIPGLPSWPKIWPRLNWKLGLELLGATHSTFTDGPMIADLLFNGSVPQEWLDLVGEVPGVRARDIITDYVVAFFREMLDGEAQELLDGESEAFPEVKLIDDLLS
jgi:pimeloyl-ACP methyl ester carboxylesterase